MLKRERRPPTPFIIVCVVGPFCWSMRDLISRRELMKASFSVLAWLRSLMVLTTFLLMLRLNGGWNFVTEIFVDEIRWKRQRRFLVVQGGIKIVQKMIQGWSRLDSVSWRRKMVVCMKELVLVVDSLQIRLASWWRNVVMFLNSDRHSREWLRQLERARLLFHWNSLPSTWTQNSVLMFLSLTTMEHIHKSLLSRRPLREVRILAPLEIQFACDKSKHAGWDIIICVLVCVFPPLSIPHLAVTVRCWSQMKKVVLTMYLCTQSRCVRVSVWSRLDLYLVIMLSSATALQCLFVWPDIIPHEERPLLALPHWFWMPLQLDFVCKVSNAYGKTGAAPSNYDAKTPLHLGRGR